VVSWVGRRMGVLDAGGDRRRERSSFGVNVGHPIVTNADFVAQLFSAVIGGDADLPKLLWDFLLLLLGTALLVVITGTQVLFS